MTQASTSNPLFDIHWIALWRHRVDVAPVRDDYAWDAAPGWETWMCTRFTTRTGRVRPLDSHVILTV